MHQEPTVNPDDQLYLTFLNKKVGLNHIQYIHSLDYISKISVRYNNALTFNSSIKSAVKIGKKPFV